MRGSIEWRQSFGHYCAYPKILQIAANYRSMLILFRKTKGSIVESYGWYAECDMLRRTNHENKHKDTHRQSEKVNTLDELWNKIYAADLQN